MNEVFEFLKGAGTFYLATVEGDQPRLRPMGFIMIHDGKLCFSTNNTKPMFKQMKANPKIEICGTGKDGRWIRVAGPVDFFVGTEAKAEAIKASPQLGNMYKADDGIFEVFYFKPGAAKAVIQGFQGGAQEITF